MNSTRGYCSVGTVHREVAVRAREEARVLSARYASRGALPTAGKRDFLLISCLIRLIHLLSLYREVYLTYKQNLLDP